MDDDASSRRRTAEISSVSNPRTDHHVRDAVSTGWTDEKHSTFLNSLEASFVDQMYTKNNFSKELPGWLSRWRKREQSSGSDQCRIIQEDSLESQNLVSERAKTLNDMKIDSVPLGSNQWIRRLKKIPAINETKSKSSKTIDDVGVFASQLQQQQNQKYSEEKCLEKLSPFLEIRPQHSIASNREASGQNFVGDKLDTGESRIFKKRRLNSKSPHIIPTKDQVVPSNNASLAPNFNVEHTCPSKENAECSRKPSQQNNSLPDEGD